MKERLTQLMLEQPFERIMEIAVEEGITVHYDVRRGDYYAKYWMRSGNAGTATEHTIDNQKKIQLAVIKAILSMHVEENK